MNRRAILKGLGAGAVGLAGLSGVSSATAAQESDAPSATIKEYDDSHMVIDIHDIEIPSIDIAVVFADGSEERYVNEVVDNRAVLTELPGGIELKHVTISHDDTELLSTYLPNGVGSDGEYVPVSDSIAYTYRYGTWWPDTYDDNSQTGYDPDPDYFYVRGNRKRALVIAPVPFKVVYATHGHGKGNGGKHDHDLESWGCGHGKNDGKNDGKHGKNDGKNDGKHGKNDGKHGKKKRCKKRKPVYAKPVRFEDVDVAASDVSFEVNGQTVWVATIPYGRHRRMKTSNGNAEHSDGGKCGEKKDGHHGKCGEKKNGHHGKCGEKKNGHHGKCGEKKNGHHGKCGEKKNGHHGKCGEKKNGGKLCWFRVHPKFPNNS